MEHEIRPLSPVQKLTSRNLHRALQDTAQVTVHSELPADAFAAYLERMNAVRTAREKPRITTTQAVIKCTATALGFHPALNAHFDGSALKCFRSVDIGIAVSADNGDLVVPVIRGAGTMTLDDLCDSARDITERARAGRLALADLKGATFTVSSIARFSNALFATPIVSPPQVAILSVGALRESAVVRDGRIAVGRILPVSLTIDHRPVNGSEATAFIETLAGLLDKPQDVFGPLEEAAALQEEQDD